MARKAQTNEEPFGWRGFLQHLTSFGVVLLFFALVMGLVIGMRPLESRAASLVTFPSPPIHIAWPLIEGEAGKPSRTWLPAKDQEDLLAVARKALGEPDPFGREPLERIGVAMRDSGWFHGTPRIMRKPGGAIEITGRWRVPGAVVRYDGQDFLISWDGMPMPPVYPPGATSLPVILDPSLGPPRIDGKRDFSSAWRGEDIAASLELIQLIMDRPWWKQVAGIDASEFEKTRSLSIATKAGTRVVWGGRPSKPRMGDASTQQKLANINSLLLRFGRIDANVQKVDVSSRALELDDSATGGRR